MQVQVDIAFDQLVRIVKELPAAKLQQLEDEIKKSKAVDKHTSKLEELLMNGPTATQKQLDTIANNRKAINEWRTK